MTQAELRYLGTVVFQLILACFLGGIIGWERERHGRPAGLRTHMLLCLGATLMMIISRAFLPPFSDPSRIAAQIVSGVGFIGAGTILRQGSIVRGLTTAASLWAVAAIGMAIGMGGKFYGVAFAATLIAYLTLSLINRLADRLVHPAELRTLVLTIHQGAELNPIFAVLAQQGAELRGFRQEFPESPGEQTISLYIQLQDASHAQRLTQALATLSQVSEVRWEM